jgi:putative membrane protein
MSFIGRFIILIFSNIIGLMASSYFIKDFIFEGDFIDLLITAAVFTLINLIFRPILKLLFGPVIVLTMGVFIIVVNALTIYVLDIISEQLTIQGYLPLLIATIIFGVINTIINTSARWLK